MKRTGILLISIVMAVVLSVTLSGCSEQKKFEGKWAAEYDLSEAFSLKMDLEDEDKDYFDFKSIDNLLVIFEFKSDGTYTMKADADSADNFLEDLKSTIKNAIIKAAEAQIKENDLNISIDDFFGTIGTSVDEIVEEGFKELNADEMMSELSKEGKYAVKEGKLYTSDSLDEDIDESIYDTYTISGSQITLIKHYGEDDDENFDKAFYPIILEKQ